MFHLLNFIVHYNEYLCTYCNYYCNYHCTLLPNESPPLSLVSDLSDVARNLIADIDFKMFSFLNDSCDIYDEMGFQDLL